MLSFHLRACDSAPDTLPLCPQPPGMWLVPVTAAKAACSGDINHEATSATLYYLSSLPLYPGSTTGAIVTGGSWRHWVQSDDGAKGLCLSHLRRWPGQWAGWEEGSFGDNDSRRCECFVQELCSLWRGSVMVLSVHGLKHI